jgi:hypothetical protein
MKIVIEFDKNIFIEKIEKQIRNFIIFFYKWLTDDKEILGYILGILHFMIGGVILFLIIISHTIYPSFYLQCISFVLLAIVWVQHVFLKVCVLIVAEQNLTNKTTSFFHKLLEDMFGITAEEFGNYLVISETVALACFGLEIISKISFIEKFLLLKRMLMSYFS